MGYEACEPGGVRVPELDEELRVAASSALKARVHLSIDQNREEFARSGWSRPFSHKVTWRRRWRCSGHLAGRWRFAQRG